MGLQEEVDILGSVPFFSGLDSGKLKLIALSCDLINFGSGEVLFNEGEKGDCAYILLEGSADVLVSGGGGEEHVIASLSRHALVGDMSLLCDIPRTATVRASESLRALRLDKETFLELLHEFPTITIAVARVLAERLHKMDKHLQELL